MSAFTDRVGVQSYSFRAFKDNRKVIELLKTCNLSRVELCGVHVNFADTASFDQVIKLYHSNAIAIDSIGVQLISDQEEMAANCFEFAKRAGVTTMSVNFKPETVPQSLRIAEKLAEKYDLRLAIHNHGGRHWLGSVQMLRHIFSMTSQRIGLCLDTAWALDSGEDPIAMAEQFADRLYGLHLKDFVFDRARKPKDAILGEGNLDLKKFVSTLRKIDFKGYAVIEYEGDELNPVTAIQRCIEAVKNLETKA